MLILVGHDSQTGNIFAHVVPKKGEHPWAVRRISQSIGAWGYPEWCIKTDGEPAIQSLTDLVRRDRMLQGERVLWEEARRGESQTNGLVENAVGLVKRQAKSMMSGLSARMKETLDTSSVWVYWLVRHAAALINRFQVGQTERQYMSA